MPLKGLGTARYKAEMINNVSASANTLGLKPSTKFRERYNCSGA
jgi:hypothetical protein